MLFAVFVPETVGRGSGIGISGGIVEVSLNGCFRIIETRDGGGGGIDGVSIMNCRIGVCEVGGRF